MTLIEPPVVPPARRIDRDLRRERRRSRQQVVLLLSAVITAAGLGLSGIASRAATYDEALPVRLAQLGWADWAELVWTREMDDAAWHLVARFVTLVPGPDLTVTRLVSLLSMATTVVLVGLLGAGMVGRRAGAVAAILTALHPGVIDAARTADGRGAALLGVVGSLVLVERATRSHARNGAAWTGAVCCATAAAYCTPMAVPVVIAAAGSLVWWRRSWTPAAVRAATAAALLVLPLLAAAATGRLTDSGLLSAARQQGNVWGRSLEALAGGAPWRVPVLVLCVVALSLAALRRTVLAWPLRGVLRQGLLLPWMCAPFVAGAASSTLAPVLRPELIVLAVPALALMAPVLARSSLDKRVAVLLLSVVTLAMLPGAVSAADAPVQRDWRWAARTVAAESAPGDLLVVLPSFELLPLSLAVDQEGLARSMPDPLPPGEGWDRPAPLESMDQPLAQELPSRRVWVVLGETDIRPAQRVVALAGRTLAFDQRRLDVRILRYDI